MQLFDGSKVFETELGGKPFTLETGILAIQAGGAVTARLGDTVILATATMSKDVRPGINFFPLTVDFEEKLYAAGRIPGSFFRREGRPSEQAILLARLVDRPLRPLFPKGMRNEVQVILTPLSVDGEHLVDPVAIIAASAALSISDIPWGGPIAGSAIGFVDGEFIVNPTASQMDNSSLNLMAAGTDDNILMVEAGANEIPEDMMLDALKLAHESMQPAIELIKRMQAEIGKPKNEVHQYLPASVVQEKVAEISTAKVNEALIAGLDKHGLQDKLAAIRTEAEEAMADFDDDEAEVSSADVEDAMSAVVKEATRRRILDEGVRPDGRSTKEIRSIRAQVGKVPRVHGSGLFMRGDTHVLTIATLGTPGDAQRLDTLQPTDDKRYMHH